MFAVDRCIPSNKRCTWDWAEFLRIFNRSAPAGILAYPAGNLSCLGIGVDNSKGNQATATGQSKESLLASRAANSLKDLGWPSTQAPQAPEASRNSPEVTSPPDNTTVDEPDDYERWVRKQREELLEEQKRRKEEELLEKERQEEEEREKKR